MIFVPISDDHWPVKTSWNSRRSYCQQHARISPSRNGWRGEQTEGWCCVGSKKSSGSGSQGRTFLVISVVLLHGNLRRVEWNLPSLLMHRSSSSHHSHGRSAAGGCSAGYSHTQPKPPQRSQQTTFPVFPSASTQDTQPVPLHWMQSIASDGRTGSSRSNSGKLQTLTPTTTADHASYGSVTS